MPIYVEQYINNGFGDARYASRHEYLKGADRQPRANNIDGKKDITEKTKTTEKKVRPTAGSIDAKF